MSEKGKFWQAVDKRAKANNPSPVQVGKILSVSPLSIEFHSLVLSKANGDTIYINHLLLDENINLNLSSMDQAQNLNDMSPEPWIAQDTPNGSYTAKISGTQKQFLTDFYNWTKAVHNRYILHIGDMVAVQKLGNNTYLVLEKVQAVS